jgi:Cu-Zn family superoxide dismutase
MRHASLAILVACGMTACASAPPPVPTTPAAQSTAKSGVANLAPASGSLVSGRIALAPMTDGVHLTGTIGGLMPNSTHAIHVHEKGDCSAADASSAGGHFNPSNSAHGRAGTPTHHAGDMDNIVATGQGTALVDIHLRGVTLGGGAANDIAGRALVVHAAADDYVSQPAGNAGARTACAVIQATP